MKNKRVKILLVVVCILILIPFIAMQFTDEVNWTILDFGVMAILLLGTILLCELVIRKVNTKKNRIILCVVILFGLLLLWAELAVGIIGTPFGGS